MTTVTIPVSATRGYSTAVFSQYGLEVQSTKLQASGHFLASETMGGKLRHFLAELDAIGEECSSANWDGDDALPLNKSAVENAKALVRSLPIHVEYPSPGAEPDGHVTLEWYRSPNKLLSVSVGPAGELHWAATLGDEGFHGKSILLDRPPTEIVHLIRRVTRE